MSIKEVLAGIAVADLESAKEWYERLLGRPPDALPMEGLVEWHFAGMGALQLTLDQARAGGSLLTLSVDDVEQFAGAARERGLDVGQVDGTTSDKVLFVIVTDPEGNGVSLVEAR